MANRILVTFCFHIEFHKMATVINCFEKIFKNFLNYLFTVWLIASFDPLSSQVGCFQNSQHDMLRHLISQKITFQKDTMASTLNCQNVMGNSLFTHFVCLYTTKDILQKNTLKMAEIANSLKENIMQNILNKHFQACICKNYL